MWETGLGLSCNNVVVNCLTIKVNNKGLTVKVNNIMMLVANLANTK